MMLLSVTIVTSAAIVLLFQVGVISCFLRQREVFEVAPFVSKERLYIVQIHIEL